MCVCLFVVSQSLTGHKNPVECVQFNVSEDQLVTGSQSGSIRVWDMEAAKSEAQFVLCVGNEQSVRGLAFYLQSLKSCLVTLATVSDSGAPLMRKRNERDD